MDAQPTTVVEFFNSLSVPFEQRSKLLSLALARAIAYHLPLPCERVQDPYIYFTTELKMTVDRTVAKYNEVILLDFNAVAETTRRLWLFRYRLLHDCYSPNVLSFMDAMVRVGCKEVPAEVSTLMVDVDFEVLNRLVSYFDDTYAEAANVST